MASKTFNMYCDESTHLQKDSMPFMLISYICCPYNQLKKHKEEIKELKYKHSFRGEIKWVNVSESKYDFFDDLIRYFFKSDLTFRSIIVKKEQIDENREGFTYDDFYFKMYYQLLFHKINPDYHYNIYLDIKDTCSQSKLGRLSEILDHTQAISKIQFIKSYESSLMQLSDLIMGAINYHLRQENKVMAKNKLIEIIQSHTKLSLKRSTHKHEEKFNLFFIELK
jgi:hypothetical protein